MRFISNAASVGKVPRILCVAIIIKKMYLFASLLGVVLLLSQFFYWLGPFSTNDTRFLIEKFGPAVCALLGIYMPLWIISCILLRQNISVAFIKANKLDDDVRSLIESASSPVTWNDLVSIIEARRVKSFRLKQLRAISHEN